MDWFDWFGVGVAVAFLAAAVLVLLWGHDEDNPYD